MNDSRLQDFTDITDLLTGERPSTGNTAAQRSIDSATEQQALVTYLRNARTELQMPPQNEEADDLSRRLEVVSRQLANEVRLERDSRRFVRVVTQRLGYGRRGLLAMCGIIIGIGLLSLAAGRKWERSHLTTALASKTFTYTTGPGRQATISLPDGTLVLLNVASRLDVPADFAVGNREVTLQGEAFFDVKHRTATPFVVQAGESNTTVLGTRFAVRRYPSDSAAIVAVDDGKVSVNRTILTAQEQIVVRSNEASAVTKVSPERFSFTKGTMMLNRVLLRDAVRDLDRWYGAVIRIADPELETIVLTLEAGNGSLADLAAILELTLGVRVERSGNTLTLFQR